MASDETTRQRVLGLIVSQGPVTAAEMAERLGVTPAGIRRHLAHLDEAGHIAEHEVPGAHDRGRGRPARAYVATAAGQRALGSAYANVAVDALAFLRDNGDLDAFVAAESLALETALASAVDPSSPLADRVQAVADVLDERGYAPSVRPLPGGYAIQLCQGHCPVQSVAEAAPEWCEEETRAISRVLGVHVQRLSTLAGGAHVCTTNIPLAVAGKEGS
jgi:predicted ArsR family transcriptional regulator